VIYGQTRIQTFKTRFKKLGNKKARKRMKDGLRSHPEEAHWDEVDYGNCKTENMKKYSGEK
jgi:hypothetical protein